MKSNTNKAIEFLLARGNLPILYWLKKDILEVPVDRESKNLQKFAKRIRILESQKPNGGWSKKKEDRDPRWEKTYYIVDTIRSVYQLYSYGCMKEDEGVEKAVDFIFSTQSKEGDFRGAYLNEYAPTYQALIIEILCHLGYHGDKRVQAGFKWFMKNKQDDGGWLIPYRTINKHELKKRYNYEAQLTLDPVKPDSQMPSSHLVTGMVLRAMAASPTWKKSKEARRAGDLLISRFFKPDLYQDRQQAIYWQELTYPFWATDILSSLDSLSRIGFNLSDDGIKKAFQWLMENQNGQGYWQSGMKKSGLEDHLWVTLSVLRVIKNFGLLQL
ncbi:MAG: hypothetical protein KKD56_03245 [Acidobacteria bacterium]|nr:hypothetical protein [Acidobacteriota bacterium]MCG2815694.1 hypothetical protein [Candidatus Aminicenantes bacterium]MBU1338064.1 hypothetical protein [Acidobacteriota bacterium]MBU1473945.1 hypothetical protein [Acidobacteriota bacterium]MBU4204468.1 hypothetical protein [Acidobacteriota bacterium]